MGVLLAGEALTSAALGEHQTSSKSMLHDRGEDLGRGFTLRDGAWLGQDMGDARRNVVLSPAANSPDVMTRVLEAVGAGARTSRDLHKSTGLSQQTVRSYLQSAEWLGFLSSSSVAELSGLGMEYVYAGPRRSRVYAMAVWSVPMAADLLTASDGRLPELERIKEAIAEFAPELAQTTIARRASALRSLIAPAVGRRRVAARDTTERQLPLPLEVSAAVEAPLRLPRRLSGDVDPDAYRFVLASLVDFGELTLSHVRALLDRVGGEIAPLPGVIALALARGDAVLVDQTLVVTPGAIERRDLLVNAASVVLSDPGYRRYPGLSVGARYHRMSFSFAN